MLRMDAGGAQPRVHGPGNLRRAYLATTLRTESNAASTGHRPCPASDAQLLRPSCRARMRRSMGEEVEAGIKSSPSDEPIAFE